MAEERTEIWLIEHCQADVQETGCRAHNAGHARFLGMSLSLSLLPICRMQVTISAKFFIPPYQGLK